MEKMGVTEAAAAMDVSVDTVRRYIRDGKLDARREGAKGRWVVEVPDDLRRTRGRLHGAFGQVDAVREELIRALARIEDLERENDRLWSLVEQRLGVKPQ